MMSFIEFCEILVYPQCSGVYLVKSQEMRDVRGIPNAIIEGCAAELMEVDKSES